MARPRFKIQTISMLSISSCLFLFSPAIAADSPLPSPAKVTVYPLVKDGYDLLQKGAYLDAVQSLCQAVILDRDDVSARRYLALALIKADNADRALEQMGLVGRLTPPSAFDYFIYGEAFFALAKYKEAEESYRDSLTKDPDSDTARAGIVKSLVGSSEFDKAIAECQKYLKQAKTKEQKAYFQTVLKKVKEAKAGPPPEDQGEQIPPSVPAPLPASTTPVVSPASTAPQSQPSPSAGNTGTAPVLPMGPPLPPTAVPPSAVPQAQAPTSAPAQTTTTIPTGQSMPAKTTIVVPKTSVPSVKGSPGLP